MKANMAMAQAVGAAAAWGLKRVFKRPAANFPGKVGLRIDAHLIADLRPRLREGSIVIVGTNGKTTVTNLVADALEASGKAVACNRTGANLDSGVATALMDGAAADWGVFESDELWLAKIAPELKPRLVVLLNLFRDQLDRMGEIALIQDSIAGALATSPDTTLEYNADDPLCQDIADRVRNKCVPFGVDECLGLAQNAVSDAGMCQRCDAMLEYGWRQYGQLGGYACPQCGFARAVPVYTACEVRISSSGAKLTLRGGAADMRLDEPFAGVYMVYNVLAAYAACDLCGVPHMAFGRAVRDFDPHNGRLQRYEIDGTDVLLNLAKNPVGFNQNLKIIADDPGPKAAAFFINDKEADGHDVSWLWDVDFQELALSEGLVAFAGGSRRNDLQVRLKHAGISAELIGGAGEFLRKARKADPRATCYLIANYTALPEAKAELDRMSETGALPVDGSGASCGESPRRPCPSRLVRQDEQRLSGSRRGVEAPLRIVHLYPTLLNLYGDGGNVTVLANRARWRGMEVEVIRTEVGADFDLSDADIVFLGGGPDREQRLASCELLEHAGEVRAYVESDGVLLAICGGFQMLGCEWVMGEQPVAGLGVFDAVTKRAAGNAHNRLVGNVALKAAIASMPVIGYENHAGRTFLGEGAVPFGRVLSGWGNNDARVADGAIYRNAVGTYLHGPLLAKNPEIADWLIERALARCADAEGLPAPPALHPLGDSEERAANAFMCKELGLRG